MFSVASLAATCSLNASLKNVPAIGSFVRSVEPRRMIESYSESILGYFDRPPEKSSVIGTAARFWVKARGNAVVFVSRNSLFQTPVLAEPDVIRNTGIDLFRPNRP